MERMQRTSFCPWWAQGAGSYVKHPAGGIHYDGAKDEEVIVEIRGIGPVESVYLED